MGAQKGPNIKETQYYCEYVFFCIELPLLDDVVQCHACARDGMGARIRVSPHVIFGPSARMPHSPGPTATPRGWRGPGSALAGRRARQIRRTSPAAAIAEISIANAMRMISHARTCLPIGRYCKVYMANHAAVRQKHENGTKHKAAVEARIRGMRYAEKDKEREAARTKATMEQIERSAIAKYREQDEGGEWEFKDTTGYHYNATHRYYYDAKTKMYYGGTPPDWTDKPDIPPSALYRERSPGKDALLAGVGVSKYPKGMKVGQIDHPLAGVGGYQMPTDGEFGIGRVGVASGGVKKKVFEKRDDGKPLTKRQQEELEFLKKREAAKRRVDKRTKAQFGMT